MRFKLPTLHFGFDALAPAISAETLAVHYGKHHQGYVDKLNQLIEGSGFEEAPLEQIIKEAKGDLLNQAAQVWNHEFYWLGLNSPEKCHPIAQWPKLKGLLEENFGEVRSFLEEFGSVAEKHFGSGWAWLVQDPQTEKLSVISTSDAENPLQQGLIPLWTCDVWEHAYYLDYKNERKKYLENIWSITNWEFV